MPPLFPDIEIEIPGLVEIKNELKQTRALLDALQSEVATNKQWRTALETSLMSYGIDLDAQQSSSATTLSPSSKFSTPIITNVRSSLPSSSSTTENSTQDEAILGFQESDFNSSTNCQTQDTSSQITEPPNVSSFDNLSHQGRLLIKQEIHFGRTLEENNSGENESAFTNSPNPCPPVNEQPLEDEVNEGNGATSTSNLHDQSHNISSQSQLLTSPSPPSHSEINLNDAHTAATAVVVHPFNRSEVHSGNDSLISNIKERVLATEIPKVPPLQDRYGDMTAVVAPEFHQNVHNSNILPSVGGGINGESNVTNLTGSGLKQKRRMKRKKLKFTTTSKASLVRPKNPKVDPANSIEIQTGSVADQKLYKCKLCTFVNDDPDTTKRHIQLKHLHERKYSCQFCSQRFKLPHHREKHIISQHPEVDLTSRIKKLPSNPTTNGNTGDQIFSISSVQGHRKDSMEGLYQPYIDDERRRAFLCIRCGIISYVEESIRTHIRKEHKDLLVSNQEVEPLPSSSSLSTPMTSLQASLVCEHCLKKFINRKELEVHKGRCNKALIFHQLNNKNSESLARASINSSSDDDMVNCNINVNMDFSSQNRQASIKNRNDLNRFGIGQKKRIRGQGMWTFSDKMKKILDKYIDNVKSPKPPYGCKLCTSILKTRQSARRHVQNSHKHVHEGHDVT